MENFNLSTANAMYDYNLDFQRPEYYDYVKKYFIPLTNGQHIMIEYDDNGEVMYTTKDDATIKKVYFNRMHKDMTNFYFKKYDQVKKLTCELNKPLFYGNYINTCPPFMYSVKPYEEFSSDLKEKVCVMINYLKEIWCSNDDQLQYLLKWFSNMARGNKNQSVLYLRSEEGTGKSTFTDF